MLVTYSTNAQINLKSANINFITPRGTEDKDFDTKLTISLYLSDGTLIGTAANNSCTTSSSANDVKGCFCCVAPVKDPGNNRIVDPKTMFVDDGSDRGPFAIKLSKQATMEQLKTGYFVITMTAVGRDRWVFKPRLTFQFVDGSTIVYNDLSSAVIQQDAPNATIVFHR